MLNIVAQNFGLKQGIFEAEQAKAILNRICEVNARSTAVHRNETRAKRTGEANLTQFWLKRQVSIQSLILDAFLTQKYNKAQKTSVIYE